MLFIYKFNFKIHKNIFSEAVEVNKNLFKYYNNKIKRIWSANKLLKFHK